MWTALLNGRWIELKFLKKIINEFFVGLIEPAIVKKPVSEIKRTLIWKDRLLNVPMIINITEIKMWLQTLINVIVGRVIISQFKVAVILNVQKNYRFWGSAKNIE